MSLKDLDRPAVVFHYDRWDRDITFRSIDALAYVKIAGGFGELDGVAADAPEAIRFYAALLAATCESPQYTEEEWLEASGETLISLGLRALQVNGLTSEEAKKNLTTRSTDSLSSSAGS